MSKQKAGRRAVGIVVLLALVGVAGIAVLLTRSEPRKAARTSAEPSAEPELADAPAVQREPSPPALAAVPSADTEETAPVELDASAAAAPQGESSGADAGSMSPELRRHALLMIPPTVLQAVESENIVHVRALRDQLAARRSDNLLSAADFEALDLIIDCMEHAQDAREEGRDFLEFGGTTMVSEALKRACE